MQITVACSKCHYPLIATIAGTCIIVDPCPCQLPKKCDSVQEVVDKTKGGYRISMDELIGSRNASIAKHIKNLQSQQKTCKPDQHKYAATDDPNWPYPTVKPLERKCSACGHEKRMDCGRVDPFGVFTCNDCQ